MFIIMINANFTYGLSILLAGAGADYILRHLPWLVGSLGCCVFDSVIVGQFFLYAPQLIRDENPRPDEEQGLLDAEQGLSESHED